MRKHSRTRAADRQCTQWSDYTEIWSLLHVRGLYVYLTAILKGLIKYDPMYDPLRHARRNESSGTAVHTLTDVEGQPL